jgi:hypothetical protein
MYMTMHRAWYRDRSALLLLAALASCDFPRPPDIVDGGGGQDNLAVTLDASRVRIRTEATASDPALPVLAVTPGRTGLLR